MHDMMACTPACMHKWHLMVGCKQCVRRLGRGGSAGVVTRPRLSHTVPIICSCLVAVCESLKLKSSHENPFEITNAAIDWLMQRGSCFSQSLTDTSRRVFGSYVQPKLRVLSNVCWLCWEYSNVYSCSGTRDVFILYFEKDETSPLAVQ